MARMAGPLVRWEKPRRSRRSVLAGRQGRPRRQDRRGHPGPCRGGRRPAPGGGEPQGRAPGGRPEQQHQRRPSPAAQQQGEGAPPRRPIPLQVAGVVHREHRGHQQEGGQGGEPGAGRQRPARHPGGEQEQDVAQEAAGEQLAERGAGDGQGPRVVQEAHQHPCQARRGHRPAGQHRQAEAVEEGHGVQGGGDQEGAPGRGSLVHQHLVRLPVEAGVVLAAQEAVEAVEGGRAHVHGQHGHAHQQEAGQREAAGGPAGARPRAHRIQRAQQEGGEADHLGAQLDEVPELPQGHQCYDTAAGASLPIERDRRAGPYGPAASMAVST